MLDMKMIVRFAVDACVPTPELAVESNPIVKNGTWIYEKQK